MAKRFYTSLIVQAALIICFLVFTYQADRAMSKDGLGDLTLWHKYKHVSAIAIYTFCIVWLFTILYAQKSKLFKSHAAQIAIGIPPLILIIGWSSLWFA